MATEGVVLAHQRQAIADHPNPSEGAAQARATKLQAAGGEAVPWPVASETENSIRRDSEDYRKGNGLMPRRIKSKPQSNGTIDDLPPHNADAERGALGCICIAPDLLATVKEAGGEDLFWTAHARATFKSLCRVKHIDLAFIRDDLKRHHIELPAGYADSLPDATPSAQNLPYYLDILKEHSQLRRMLASVIGIKQRIENFTGDFEEFSWGVQSDIQRLLPTDIARFGDIYTPSQLDAFDVERDTNCLIGRRWICRGGKIMLVAPSGLGKSTLAVQLAILWALGFNFCGIGPASKVPLSSVVIGDENDQGDLAEMFQGVRDGLRLSSFDDPDKFTLLDQNLKFFHWPSQSGEQFLSAVQNWLVQHPTDIAWLDPLVSYADVDITKQDGAAQFLRRGLSRISQQTGVVWIVIHHTPKPSQSEGKFRARKLSEYQYSGAGSYDLSGWARGTMTLEESQDSIYRLVLGKRGERSGACHPDGTPTRVLWLRHAEGNRVCWEQIEPPKEPEPTERKGGRKSKTDEATGQNIHGFLSKCTTEGEGRNAIAKRFAQWVSRDANTTVDLSESGAIRAIAKLVETKMLEKNVEGLYIKGKNA